MAKSVAASNSGISARKAFIWAVLLMAALLIALFGKGLLPGMIVFSNDGPLGIIKEGTERLPEGLKAVWLQKNWVGSHGISASPTLSMFFAWLCALLKGPDAAVLFSKFYPVLALLMLGIATWTLFRKLGFNAATCTIGALGSILNTGAFAIACWGLPYWTLGRAFIFFALAALVSINRGQPWIRTALAGLAVGMAVSEGFDVGAVCSLIVAAFVLFQTLVEPGAIPGKILKGAMRVALVAFCAGLLAAQTLSTIFGTQVQGIAFAQKDLKTKSQQWDWATQWSLPKVETLRVLIGGLFGYRMDTADGGEYWGTVGQQPGWEIDHRGLPRHSGSGEYAGVLVVLVAAWAISQAFRRKESPFNNEEKKYVRFWAVTALICLLFAFGRHAPFYRIIYALPYFSTMRNPVKFMHPFHISLLILFGYGLQGLSQLYLEKATNATKSIREQLKAWWAAAPVFDKRWTIALFAFVGVSVLGFLVYSSSSRELQSHLAAGGFPPAEAQAIASFSLKEYGWYLLFLFLSGGALVFVFSGYFSGSRARFAAIVLGLVLMSDLVRANQPWIRVVNYKQKYALDPIADFLRQKPYEGRVTVPGLPIDRPEFEKAQQVYMMLQQVYGIYWMQHNFPYYEIQSLDVVQEPRLPEEKVAFQSALGSNLFRYWQMTNTRYLFGFVGLDSWLNQFMDPEKQSFRERIRFTMRQENTEAVLVETNSTGPFTLIEFTRALPRAKLYTQWQIDTNNESALKTIASPSFDPEQTVVVAREMSAPPPVSTNAPAGTVQITNYEPIDIKLKSDAPSPTVLLLNDRYDPDWKVTVDGKPDSLFRANFIMRGVYLPSGSHTIEFQFRPSTKALFISLSAIALGLVLFALLFIGPRKEPVPQK